VILANANIVYELNDWELKMANSDCF
jgi:hypothetical protein